MQFILYKLESADNVINKTMVEPLAMDITLRRGVDIVAPVLRIVYSAGVSPNEYNYCHIPELERFYFIRDIQSINSGIWELYLECDVLESYKTEILSCNARLKRNIRTGDYLDASLDMSVNRVSSTFESNKGFEGEPSLILTTVGA